MRAPDALRREKKRKPECIFRPTYADTSLGRLWGLGTVGGATTLALASVLSGVLAATLALAVILALAGVLGGIRSGLREKYASVDSGSIVMRYLLRGHPSCCTAKKAGNDCGQSKRFCGIH